MIYIESNTTNPYSNLALEEYVFEKLPKDEQYFILWQNANTIVIGKYQNTLEEVNQEYVDANHIMVARRLSGGGAVYHDMGNLNFTFIVDQKDAENFNFSKFVVPVCNALKKLGINAEFNGRNDIVIDGKKFSGNSQYAKGERVMHHGCIMLDSNTDVVSKALNVKDAKFKSKNAKSVRSRVTTINANSERRISMQEFKEALKAEILGDKDAKPYVLSKEDETAIEKLAREKYATWDWNYGQSKKYEMERTEKFEGGMVTVSMTAEDGIILGIKFSGDFFGNGEISELENSLIGLPIDENLKKHLEYMNLNYYMNGISESELTTLIRG